MICAHFLVAFRVSGECASSAVLARQVLRPDVTLLTIASGLDRHRRV
jgi:hypothetical protein